MEYDSLTRDLTVHLPANFHADSIYSVVFFFHGLGGNKGFGESVIGPLVDEGQFIGIYPQGHLNSWNAGSGGVPSTEDDVGFTLHILEWLGAQIKIAENKLYSLGYSNGGAFSYTLALQTDRFAAIASLSASFFAGRTIDPDVNKISVIHIHGELDTVVPYEGGDSINLPISFVSAMGTVTAWVVHNGLSQIPEESQPDALMTLYTFKENDNPYEIRLYRLHETNHNIGVHTYVNTYQCYEDIWDFFHEHPKIALPNGKKILQKLY